MAERVGEKNIVDQADLAERADLFDTFHAIAGIPLRVAIADAAGGGDRRGQLIGHGRADAQLVTLLEFRLGIETIAAIFAVDPVTQKFYGKCWRCQDGEHGQEGENEQG